LFWRLSFKPVSFGMQAFFIVGRPSNHLPPLSLEERKDSACYTAGDLHLVLQLHFLLKILCFNEKLKLSKRMKERLSTILLTSTKWSKLALTQKNYPMIFLMVNHKNYNQSNSIFFFKTEKK
jgi:hypothetical protein